MVVTCPRKVDPISSSIRTINNGCGNANNDNGQNYYFHPLSGWALEKAFKI